MYIGAVRYTAEEPAASSSLWGVHIVLRNHIHCPLCSFLYQSTNVFMPTMCQLPCWVLRIHVGAGQAQGHSWRQSLDVGGGWVGPNSVPDMQLPSTFPRPALVEGVGYRSENHTAPALKCSWNRRDIPENEILYFWFFILLLLIKFDEHLSWVRHYNAMSIYSCHPHVDSEKVSDYPHFRRGPVTCLRSHHWWVTGLRLKPRASCLQDSSFSTHHATLVHGILFCLVISRSLQTRHDSNLFQSICAWVSKL